MNTASSSSYRVGENTSSPSSPSELSLVGRLSTPPPQPARMKCATAAASEERGLPVQPTSEHIGIDMVQHSVTTPSEVMAGPATSPGCHRDVARGKAPACMRSLSSSPVLEHPLEQSLTSHTTTGDEPRAITPSWNGSPVAVGTSGMVSPSSVVTPFGITTPASSTLTSASICRNGSRSFVAEDSMKKAMRHEASRHLKYSEDAGPSETLMEAADSGAGMPAGDRQIEQHRPSRDAVIPKVRAQLRRATGDLFTPHTILIGPYNRDSYSWLCAQEKKRAVDDLERVGVDLSDLKQVVDGMESEARGCYTDLPNDEHAMDSEKFCRMLLHDGCYLLSSFASFQREETTEGSDISNDGTNIDNTVLRDILYLVENQLPLFVIVEILEYLRARSAAVMLIGEAVKKVLMKQLYISGTTWVVPSTSSHLLDMVYSYLGSQHLQQQLEEEQHQQLGEEQQQQLEEEEQRSTVPEGSRTRRWRWATKNLLDQVYSYFTASEPKVSCTGRWRRATEYRRYADLLFKPRAFGAADKWTILGVRLDGGSLSIPLLRVDSNTWTLLRNLMALEEQKEARPVTAYCLFMSQLACTAEDVEFLRGAKVIEHFLGSDKSAAEGFADLCHGVVLDIDKLERNYLKPIWHRLEKRCGVRVHNFKGLFREKYCSNVFYLFVFFIAFILFGSQVLQSIYAVIAYHKPNNSAAVHRQNY